MALDTSAPVSVSIIPSELATLQLELRAGAKLSNLAMLRALFRTGGLARTRIIREVASRLGAKQKAIRPLVRVYRGQLSNMRVRVWHGFRARIRHREDPAAVAKAHPGARVMRLVNGYIGRFYAHANGQITEATVNIEPVVEDVSPRIVDQVRAERLADLYWRDLEFRLVQRGWRRGGR